VGKTESPFEREVLKRLTGAGFRVKTQWQVGYYRIDMVVEGAGKRLAIECDGDRYHPIEKLADDMERQSILERLGWQFLRIRGSVFYRNPDTAMRPVFDRLEEMEIPPEAHVDAPQASDMTLIHELDELIRIGFGLDSEDNLMQTSTELSPDEAVETLLGRLGGSASLPTFLRDYAKLKGFQRLSSTLRKSLEEELEKLAHKGTIEIKQGMIRLIA
jgi:very-short-patch-repair endonuclease